MFKITLCYNQDVLGYPTDELMIAFKDEAENAYYDFILEHRELELHVFLEFNSEFSFWTGGDGYCGPEMLIPYLGKFGPVYFEDTLKAGIHWLIDQDEEYPNQKECSLFWELYNELLVIHKKHFPGFS